MAITDVAAWRLDESRYSQAPLDRLGGTADGRETVRTGGTDFSGLLKTLPAESGGEAEKTPAAKPFVDRTDKLYEQCEALETFLLKTLINGMRKTVDKTGLNAGGFAGEIYEDMLYDEYAKDFTRGANFGLAELAYLELTGQRGRAFASQRAPE